LQSSPHRSGDHPDALAEKEARSERYSRELAFGIGRQVIGAIVWNAELGEWFSFSTPHLCHLLLVVVAGVAIVVIAVAVPLVGLIVSSLPFSHTSRGTRILRSL
jgi:hypothetical protein